MSFLASLWLSLLTNHDIIELRQSTWPLFPLSVFHFFPFCFSFICLFLMYVLTTLLCYLLIVAFILAIFSISYSITIIPVIIIIVITVVLAIMLYIYIFFLRWILIRHLKYAWPITVRCKDCIEMPNPTEMFIHVILV